jgi:hypothetical protein
MRRTLLWPALVAGVGVAAVLLGGGIALAAIPGPNDVIHGCLKNKGQVYLVDPGAGQTTPRAAGSQLASWRAIAQARRPRSTTWNGGGRDASLQMKPMLVGNRSRQLFSTEQISASGPTSALLSCC